MAKATKKLMPEFISQVETMNTASLVPAPWNYKASGSAEQLSRFEKSLLSGKMTPLHVAERAEEPGVLEVLDGVHRLAICKRLKVPRVLAYNRGVLTLEERKQLSIQLNGQWFGIETMAMAECLDAVISANSDVAELLPFDTVELEQALASLSLDASLDAIGDYDEDELPDVKPRKGRQPKAGGLQTIKCPSCGERFNL